MIRTTLDASVPGHRYIVDTCDLAATTVLSHGNTSTPALYVSPLIRRVTQDMRSTSLSEPCRRAGTANLRPIALDDGQTILLRLEKSGRVPRPSNYPISRDRNVDSDSVSE